MLSLNWKKCIVESRFQRSDVRLYKLLKYLLGADKMAQFGEFNAQNPCEKQLSVMHTPVSEHCGRRGRWNLGLASALSMWRVPSQ